MDEGDKRESTGSSDGSKHHSDEEPEPSPDKKNPKQHSYTYWVIGKS